MKPKLYKSDAMEFNGSGYGTLRSVIECTVTEELGVAPTLELTIMMNDPLFANVAVDNIIAVKPNKTTVVQAFVIEEVTKPIDGIVTVYATHIAQHRTKLIPVSPFTAETLDEALSMMVASSMESNPFTLVRDENKNNVHATMSPTVPHSFRELMGGVSGSVLDIYRGEWEYNNFTCTLYNKRGNDNGATVMYGRNMSNFELEEQFNWNGSATGVIGYWVGETNTVISDIQYSDYKDLYPYAKTVCMDFTDRFDTEPTKEQLNNYALNWVNGKGLFGASVDVKFASLTDTGNVDIALGDTVHIKNTQYDFEMDSRIVGLEFDVLAEQYTNITIGELKTTLNEAIADIGGGATSGGGGGGGSSVDPSTTLPIMDGTASVGTEQTYARGDHVHPTDTSRVAKSGDTMTGDLTVQGNVWANTVSASLTLSTYANIFHNLPVNKSITFTADYDTSVLLSGGQILRNLRGIITKPTTTLIDMLAIAGGDINSIRIVINATTGQFVSLSDNSLYSQRVAYFNKTIDGQTYEVGLYGKLAIITAINGAVNKNVSANSVFVTFAQLGFDGVSATQTETKDTYNTNATYRIYCAMGTRGLCFRSAYTPTSVLRYTLVVLLQ